MNSRELMEICENISCEVGGVKWAVHNWPGENGYFIQLVYEEPDIVTGEVGPQHGRKWFVSRHSTKSEVVQTILKAALTSAEHMVREHFTYKGCHILHPHYDVDKLVELSGGMGNALIEKRS